MFSAKYTLILTLILTTHRIQTDMSTYRIGVMKAETLQMFQPEDGHLWLWFEMTSKTLNVYTDEEADLKLRTESCETLNVGLYSGWLNMCDAYDESKRITGNCPAGLLTSECRAVYMYSTNFYDTYNTNIRAGHWNYYKAFTSLLYSALVKLSRLRPLPGNTVLYRGLRGHFNIDRSPIHFTHFVSTSLDLDVAEGFGNDTLMLIKTNDLKLGAMLHGLVKFEIEREVLLTPFETFDVISSFEHYDDQNDYWRSTINFKSSPNQQFLKLLPSHARAEL